MFISQLTQSNLHFTSLFLPLISYLLLLAYFPPTLLCILISALSLTYFFSFPPFDSFNIFPTKITLPTPPSLFLIFYFLFLGYFSLTFLYISSSAFLSFISLFIPLSFTGSFSSPLFGSLNNFPAESQSSNSSLILDIISLSLSLTLSIYPHLFLSIYLSIEHFFPFSILIISLPHN